MLFGRLLTACQIRKARLEQLKSQGGGRGGSGGGGQQGPGAGGQDDDQKRQYVTHALFAAGVAGVAY
jgi:hypothetical protein